MTAVMLSNDHVWELVQSVWNTVLGQEVMRYRDATATLPLHELTARVQIQGAFNGAVQLSFANDYAVAVTAQMLALPETSVARNDVYDVLGELCNILGGGIKSLLPGPSALSLPCVARDQPLAASPGKETVVARLGFTCDQHFVEVQVLEVLEPTGGELPDITMTGNSRSTHTYTTL